MIYSNQNNVWACNAIASGFNSLNTGTVNVLGFSKFTFCLEGTVDPLTNQKASATGVLQAIVHPSQTQWAPLFTGSFVNATGALLFTNPSQGPFYAVRLALTSYSSGIINCWYSATQN